MKGRIVTTQRAQVDALLVLLDHTLEETASEFGWDHWHSLTWNLANVRDGDWNRYPPDGGRSIRELVEHLGKTYLRHEDRAFGDGTRSRDDATVDGMGPGETPAETIAWLRACHARFRNRVAELTDADLPVKRTVAWGDQLETRRLIELMIQHPLYHIGEVNHIRALLQGNDNWDHQDLGRIEGEG